jgi:cell wall-associated NlpC family hydrolase
MAYDTEDMVRNIGQIQANAMFNLYPGAGGGAMFEPGAGMSSPSSMLNPDLGPFGQAFSSMLQPDLSLNRDSAGMTAMGDLQSLKGKVEQEANLYDATKRRLQQAAFDKANAAQAAKSGMPAQARDTGGSVYDGAFPHAAMIQGYLPEDLKNDPEIMRIIAAGSHAESGWDVNRVQNGYNMGSGKGARGLFQFDMGGMGKPYLGNEQALLGEEGAKLQASQIVPKYVEAYRNRAQSGLTDKAQVASWVAAQAERPQGYDDQNSTARRNYVTSYNTVNSSPGPTAQPTGQGDWLQTAQGFLGKAYVWGGRDPNTGFDCSGFASYVNQQRGLKLSGTTMTMFPQTDAITAQQAQPGDLVFYNMDSADPHLQHVAVYIGNGQIIQSGGTSRSVNIASVNQPVGSAPIFRRARG